MHQPLTIAALSFNAKLRELLSLLAELREIRDPLTSAEGRRASLELLLRLAEFSGVNRAWTDRVRTILDDQRSFDVVLAIVRYLHGLIATEQVMQILAQHNTASSATTATDIHAQDFVDWLPLILEIIALLRELRRRSPTAS
jgi:hypothetical protein